MKKATIAPRVSQAALSVKLRLLFALIFTVILCVSCNESVSTDITVPDWQGYTLIRPDITDDETIKALQLFRSTVAEKTGVELPLATDFVKRGEAAPVGTREILIGATNRPESNGAEALGMNDYMIAFENDRLVINGGSGSAILEAVSCYLENYVKDTLYAPSEPFYHHAEYEYGELEINGIPMSEFVVEYVDGFENAAERLRDFLYNKTGFRHESSEYTVKLATDEALSFDEYEIKTTDKQITITVSRENGPMSNAIDEFIDTLENRTSNDISVNKKGSVENIGLATAEKIAEWRSETDARIEKILASENLELPDGARVYYVSNSGDDNADGLSPETAWASLNKINNAALAKGSYVCFERGGLWRGQLKAQAGVTYTAYGSGEKPRLYRSAFNAADPALWTETDKENIWSINVGTNDVGTLVFNDGEAWAIKRLAVGDPTKDLEFFHDSSIYKEHGGSGSGILYLYSNENPGSRFESIEFNSYGNVVGIAGNNVTIDNLCIKYCGSHGIGGGTANNLTVQNCELGWIGGSIQLYNTDWKSFVRYGNAIEIYGGCDGFYVSDNYIYQVYDAGITAQYITSNSIVVHKNITYTRNVIEYCNYSIEYFIKDNGTKSYIDNFLIEDNHMWYAGRGFCTQRPDYTGAAHIRGAEDTNNRASNFVIKNNLMVDSGIMLVAAFADRLNSDGTESIPVFIGNDFAAKNGALFGFAKQNDRTRVVYSPNIGDYLGDKSQNDTFWFTE